MHPFSPKLPWTYSWYAGGKPHPLSQSGGSPPWMGIWRDHRLGGVQGRKLGYTPGICLPSFPNVPYTSPTRLVSSTPWLHCSWPSPFPGTDALHLLASASPSHPEWQRSAEGQRQVLVSSTLGSDSGSTIYQVVTSLFLHVRSRDDLFLTVCFFHMRIKWNNVLMLWTWHKLNKTMIMNNVFTATNINIINKEATIDLL